MKSFLLLFLFFTAFLNAQEQPKPEAGVEALLPSQREFLNLPQEQREAFIEHLGKAARYFRQKRIFETLASIDDAEKIFSNSSELFNLRGSCYVEMRSFEKGLEMFKKALEINPKNSSIQFNLAEVLFVSEKWQEAHDKFEALLKENKVDSSWSRLIEFKILLCKKKLGKKDEALMLSEKYDYQDDSPYYYYANAVVAFDEDNLLEAEQWLARANRIFKDPNVIAPWQDTLVEYGYIKSFYGGGE